MATAGYSLQPNTNLASPEWVPVTNGVSLVGTNYQATVLLTNGSVFFRLKRP